MEETTWLEELLLCPVCHDLLADPRQLPCGHSMCLSCVEKLLDLSSESPPRCPDCRAHLGPEVGLQRSYTLGGIAEEFRLNRKTRENQRRSVYCDYCPDGVTPASKTCLQCEVSLCKDHVKSHFELPALTGHPLVEPLGDLAERKCRQHEDKVLRYYCRSSRRYICNICALESQHLSAATEASSVLRRQLTEYMDRHFEMLQGQVTDFTASMRQLQDDISNEKQRMHPANSHINGVTVVLLFLWFIVLYYAYIFSVENQMLTESLKNEQNQRSDLKGLLTPDLDSTSCSLQREREKSKLDYPQSGSCSHDAAQLLSSQCFSSGVHVWDVEAEGRWEISVFYKSFQQKTNDSSGFGNNTESWSLKHDGNGGLSAFHNRTETVLAATLKSNRIAVLVHFEDGRIVFSAVDFTTTQLHQFKAELTQPVCLNVGVQIRDKHSRASIVKAS